MSPLPPTAPRKVIVGDEPLWMEGPATASSPAPDKIKPGISSPGNAPLPRQGPSMPAVPRGKQPVVAAATLHEASATDARLRAMDRWLGGDRSAAELGDALLGRTELGPLSAAEQRHLVDRALDRDFSDIERIVERSHRDPALRDIVAQVLIKRIIKLQRQPDAPDLHRHQQATELVLPLMHTLQDHDDELGEMLSRLKRVEAQLFADAACGKERRFTGLLPEARNQILAALNVTSHTVATKEIVTTIHEFTAPRDFGQARQLGSNLAIAVSREWSPSGDAGAAATRLKEVLTRSQGGIELLYGGSPLRRQLGLKIVADFPINSAVLAQGNDPLRIPAVTQIAAHLLLKDATYGDADRDAAQARLADLLKTENGQALIFGGLDEDTIPAAARHEALIAFLSDPSLTAAGLDDIRMSSGPVSRVRRDPWASPELISRIMQTRASLIRNDEPTQLSGVDLENIVGAAMGHAPHHPDKTVAMRPIDTEQSHAMLAGKLALFSRDEGVQLVATKIREVGGPDPKVTFLPVTVSSEEFGPVQFSLFRVETAHGSQFVDHVGRSYDSFDDWLKNNKLPPGLMVYPEGGHLQTVSGDPKAGRADSLRLAHRPTPESSIGAKIVDKAAFAGGIVAGGLLIVGTGGAALAVIGVASGVWGTYRAGGELLDRHAHGQTVSLADPAARALWFNFAANASSIGAFSGKLAGRLAAGANAAAARTGPVVNALNKTAELANNAAIVNGAIELARNAGAMSADQLASESLQLVFSAVVSRVAAQRARTAAESAARLAELRAAIEMQLARLAQSRPVEATSGTHAPHAASGAGHDKIGQTHQVELAGHQPPGDGPAGTRPPGSGGNGGSGADGGHANTGKPQRSGGDVIDIDSGARERPRMAPMGAQPSATTRPVAGGPVRTPSPGELEQLDRLGQAASAAMARAKREADTGNGTIRGDVLDHLEDALGALERAVEATDPGGTSPQHRLLGELLDGYHQLPDLANTSALSRRFKNRLLEGGFERNAKGQYVSPEARAAAEAPLPEAGETRRGFEAVNQRLRNRTLPRDERTRLRQERGALITGLARAVERLRVQLRDPNLSRQNRDEIEARLTGYRNEFRGMTELDAQQFGHGSEGIRWNAAGKAASDYRTSPKFAELIPPGGVRDAFEQAWSSWMARQEQLALTETGLSAAIRRVAESVPELQPRAGEIVAAFREAIGPLAQNDRLPIQALEFGPVGADHPQAAAPTIRPVVAAPTAPAPEHATNVPHDPAQVRAAYGQAALRVARLGQAVQDSESDMRAGNATPQARARHEALVAQRDAAVKRLEELASAFGKIMAASDPTANPEATSDGARPAAPSVAERLKQYESANASRGIKGFTPEQRSELSRLAAAEMTDANLRLDIAEAEERADAQRNGRVSPDVEARAKAARGAHSEAEINWHKFVEGIELPPSLSMSLAALNAEVDSALADFNRTRELFRRSEAHPAEYVDALTRLNRAISNLFGAWRMRGDGAYASLDDVAKRMHAIAEIRSELESGTPLRELEELANAQARNLKAIDADPSVIKPWEDLAALANQTSRDWKSAPRDALREYVSRLAHRRGQIAPGSAAARDPLTLGGNSSRKPMADAAARAMMDLEILKRLASAPGSNASVLAQLGAARQRIDELYRATITASRGHTPAAPAIQQDMASLAILINEYRAQHADLRNSIGEAARHNAGGLLDQAADVTVGQLTELFFPSN
ncbi:DUF4781 domain-containing protein [Bradyrhizobium sp. U531]|uniref:DUF4781 domain-containing protein n=1 Tax=Bradyrhizobium sp. U531 TaxID=3053458 RepID=UPI003F42D382